MWAQQETHDKAWIIERFKRQFSELVRLAVPTMGMRIGMLSLGLVDMAMVGHYATDHLAWLNLANQSVIMFTNVVSLGLLMGIMVYTSNAFGSKNYQECGRIWRRNLPFTGLIGLIVLLISIPAPAILLALDQAPDVALESGKIIQILGFGMPGQILFISCFMFLEGVKRPDVGLKVMIIANIVNICLNYMLIYGVEASSTLGQIIGSVPELGAEGSAWTTGTVRWVMGLSIAGYIWFSPSIRKFGVRDPHGQTWADWSDQRQLGYASGVSLAAEVAAFSGLAIFAGWLGTLPVAAYGVANQVNGLPLMIAIGIGGAGSVRVGIAFARRDRLDTVLAAISSIILTIIIVGGLALAILAIPTDLIAIFTNDPAIFDMLLPLTLLFVGTMFFDSMQMLVSNFLRGLKETWIPTMIQAFSFICIMLPASYYFAFTVDMGVAGLFLGTLIGVFVSLVVQLLRFHQLTRK